MSSKFKLEWNDGIESEIRAAAIAAVTAGALIAEGQIKQLTPVDTGNARDSVTHDVNVSDTTVIAKVGSGLDYMIYLEFGTGEFAENGSGRKGGWAYTGADGKRHFTMGTRPAKMFRNGFKQSRGRIIKAIENRMRTVGQ